MHIYFQDQVLFFLFRGESGKFGGRYAENSPPFLKEGWRSRGGFVIFILNGHKFKPPHPDPANGTGFPLLLKRRGVKVLIKSTKPQHY